MTSRCLAAFAASTLAACASHLDSRPASGMSSTSEILTEALGGAYQQDPIGIVDRHSSFRFGFAAGISVDENQPGLNYQGEIPVSLEFGKRLTPEFELGLLFHRIGGDFHSQDSFGGVEEFEQRTWALNSRFYLEEIASAEPWIQVAIGASTITYEQVADDDSPFLRAGLGMSKPLSRSFLFEPSVSASTVFDSKDPSVPVDLSVNLGFSFIF